MKKLYVKKTKSNKKKLLLRLIGVVLILLGTSITAYVFSPLILWQIFIAPVLQSQSVVVPIPITTLVTPATIKSLFASQASAFSGVDYNDAKNWFPTAEAEGHHSQVPQYMITIPKLNITDAVVSTVDTDLAKHLVNFDGGCTPPDKGNCVIFGHSTLPQLYDPKNYKTIFANILNIKINDTIIVNVNHVIYTYKVFSISVIDPDDTSVLAQTFDDSYLTLITCTPPGTVWKRLVIRSRLQTI
ncbi:MAG: sortase [Patescibacteria group bacterium]|nr:sortase [Patescibacteria group bacterium]MDE2590819.1 sortase [Patescibacteria group bacterium]